MTTKTPYIRGLFFNVVSEYVGEVLFANSPESSNIIKPRISMKSFTGLGIVYYFFYALSLDWMIV